MSQSDSMLSLENLCGVLLNCASQDKSDRCLEVAKKLWANFHLPHTNSSTEPCISVETVIWVHFQRLRRRHWVHWSRQGKGYSRRSNSTHAFYFHKKKLLKSDTTKISTGRGGVGNFMCSSPVEPESKGHIYSDEAAVRVHTSLFFTYLGWL